MEIKVQNGTILLSIHSTLLVTNKEETLRSVADYPPFQQYIGSFEQPGSILPKAILIRSIMKMAQRIVRVIADVVVDTDGKEITQPIQLSAESPAVLLPIAVVDGKKYGIVVGQRRMSLSFFPTKEAIYGSVDETGRFTSDCNSILTSLGFNLAGVEAVGERTFTIGNEGKLPFRIFSVTANLTQQQLETIGSAESEEGRPIAVPFDVLPSLDDAKVGLAACLLS
ncbi:hypothetical protein, conserved [Angomonas deanei]|uniref:Uncharacterized protein n=1 Tax=Angomonas deanei TaxID=59799 RepID=A0A7G2CRC3_9TRYP|nr:hypothetical protein, conserved [Angomonas deanei]